MTIVAPGCSSDQLILLRSLQALAQLLPSAFEPLRDTYQVGDPAWLGVGVGVAEGVGLGLAVGTGVGVVVAVVVGIGVAVGVLLALAVGLGLGLGLKIHGTLGRTGIDGVGVGLGFLAFAVALPCEGDGVDEGASATAFCPAESDCRGPNQRNTSRQSPRMIMTPIRFTVLLPSATQFTARHPVMQSVRSHQSSTARSQIKTGRERRFVSLRGEKEK